MGFSWELGLSYAIEVAQVTGRSRAALLPPHPGDPAPPIRRGVGEQAGRHVPISRAHRPCRNPNSPGQRRSRKASGSAPASSAHSAAHPSADPMGRHARPILGVSAHRDPSGDGLRTCSDTSATPSGSAVHSRLAGGLATSGDLLASLQDGRR